MSAGANPTLGDAPLVLVAGGGVAALETLLGLERLAGERVRVELLAPEPEYRLRALSVAEPFGGAPVKAVPLGSFAGAHGALYRQGALAEVAAGEKRILTRGGQALRYDALVVACGAESRDAVPGALSFRGPGDVAALADLLAELDRGAARSVAFVVAPGSSWALPLYELALMTAARRPEAEVVLVTPEPSPLALFGARASEAVGRTLAEVGVAFVGGAEALRFGDGGLERRAGEPFRVDRAVAMPGLTPPRLAGLPHDADGWIATDAHGRVPGVEDVFAAGDVTAHPLKQGGLAAQQADAVAEAVAAWAGAPLDPAPFRPVLRGQLLMGDSSLYLHGGELEGDSEAGPRPLWWPPAKIAGKYLGPALADAGVVSLPESSYPGGLEVQVDLDDQSVASLLQAMRSA
jgi:sulfide:quinone oxidoreductase